MSKGLERPARIKQMNFVKGWINVRASARKSNSSQYIIGQMRSIVGRRHVLTAPSAMRRYCTGFRYGAGSAEAVVRPGSLVELWRIVQVCVAANRIVIMQAANTGLTGGSTPAGDDYDRRVVILNVMRISGLHLIDGGHQVICLPGTTLYELEKELRAVGREPHSVIGSSCIGASVLGGICNSSGGALVRRGPAYTEYSLFAQVNEKGELRLVNHLGIELGDHPEEILERLECGAFAEQDIEHEPHRRASDCDYPNHVRDVYADTPARFNADSRCLFEASGSAGRVIVFAVRVDTFPVDDQQVVFYIGTNEISDLAELRREILLNFENLPVAGEYLHRRAFEITEDYGKDTFLAILYLGTDRLPMLFALKSRLDGVAGRIGIRNLSDRLLQTVSKLLPAHLPFRIRDYRDRFDHHLLLKVTNDSIGEARTLLSDSFPSKSGDYFECSRKEGENAFLHRFATAGAAIRYAAVHSEEVEGILAFDVALPRKSRDWFTTLPPEIEATMLHQIHYGHFFCHVFHHDYVVAKGHDLNSLKQGIMAIFDEAGAEYPAEHNVGHLYKAKQSLAEFYRQLDPRNQFNPGIGQTSKDAGWRN